MWQEKTITIISFVVYTLFVIFYIKVLVILMLELFGFIGKQLNKIKWLS